MASLLRLLKLAPEIQEYMVGLAETDSRLRILTESRLRSVVQISSEDEQCARFWGMVDSEGILSESVASPFINLVRYDCQL